MKRAGTMKATGGALMTTTGARIEIGNPLTIRRSREDVLKIRQRMTVTEGVCMMITSLWMMGGGGITVIAPDGMTSLSASRKSGDKATTINLSRGSTSRENACTNQAEKLEAAKQKRHRPVTKAIGAQSVTARRQ